MMHMTIALKVHFTLEHDEVTIENLCDVVQSHNFNLNLRMRQKQFRENQWMTKYNILT